MLVLVFLHVRRIMKNLFLLLLVATSASGAGLYPDRNLTPGESDPNATVEKVCTAGYTATVRHVTVQDKKEVFKAYGVPYEPQKYEVDHFISLELGGVNRVAGKSITANLWPEAYSPKPGAREKDVVETTLHRLVCQKKLSLEAAQHIITTDWYAYYKELKKGK